MSRLVRVSCHIPHTVHRLTENYQLRNFVGNQPFPSDSHLKMFIAVDRSHVTVTDVFRGTKLLGLWSSTWERRVLEDPDSIGEE